MHYYYLFPSKTCLVALLIRRILRGINCASALLRVQFSWVKLNELWNSCWYDKDNRTYFRYIQMNNAHVDIKGLSYQTLSPCQSSLTWFSLKCWNCHWQFQSFLTWSVLVWQIILTRQSVFALHSDITIKGFSTFFTEFIHRNYINKWTIMLLQIVPRMLRKSIHYSFHFNAVGLHYISSEWSSSWKALLDHWIKKMSAMCVDTMPNAIA